MGVAAGSYEPVLATVFRPARTQTAAKEPKADTPAVLCKRYIRFKTLSVSENFNQLKSTSATILTIWMHKDKVTSTITSDMWIVHRGKRYGIMGNVVLEYIQDEVGFQVKLTVG